MGHTQGEWEVKETLIDSRDTMFWHTSVVANDTIRVAKSSGVGKENAEANARLIAASPKLLAICKAIKEIIDYEGEINNTATAVFEQLNQAIAKAEGE